MTSKSKLVSATSHFYHKMACLQKAFLIEKTLSDFLNKQNNLIKIVSIKELSLTKSLFLFQEFFIISHQKKDLKISIFDRSLLNHKNSVFSDIIYCQSVKINQIKK